METSFVTQTAQEAANYLVSVLNEHTSLHAKAWVKPTLTRVYLSGFGKDIKAYFNLEDSPCDAAMPGDPITESTRGWVLRVFSDCNQSQKWLRNRAKQIKHTILKALHEGGILEEVCESWEEVIL